ncbi:MAG: thioredoxin [bacterium]
MLKIIDFYADWCAPCQIMGPFIDEFKKTFEGKAEFAKVNVDSDMDTAQKYSIMSIPTFVIEKDGNEIDRKTGAIPKKSLEDWIKSYL